MTDDGGDVTALALPAATVRVAGHRRRARRSWTLGEKLAIVREIAESGDPVAEVARRHGMNANQLFTWRQMARAGSLGGRGGASPPRPVRFVDLGVVGAPAPLADGAEARIEIELPNGVIVRVPVSAAGEPLRMALASARAAL